MEPHTHDGPSVGFDANGILDVWALENSTGTRPTGPKNQREVTAAASPKLIA